ncbi:16S rRNA (guanine(1405)-N(7))-methyltransferase [Micromonospora pallida]|uniref:16S rRNA (guanine(1405)-N(7))-methyltransferase n=1 Tax=Micromonospora pallida TaxID=145854 RepID=A0A1C6TCZ5_9ACTN|nr:16S rRNA (guanine(1405)-N(7))-methyltransferase [Micromonospora pallida]
MSGVTPLPPDVDPAAASVDPPAVTKVIARLVAAAKYRDVHPETIADLVRREGRTTGDAAELERLVRARLHKVAALHLLTARPAALRRTLDRADLADPQARREWCRQVLAGHFSTAERLPDLDVFYPTLFGLVPPPETVADIACALNPFTLPWLREVSDARYVGYDFNATFAALGNAFLSRTYPGCEVRQEEVLADGHQVDADLALLLKTYHCMEGRRPGAGLALVDRLACRHVVVSFPTRAMNGRAAVFVPRHVEELAELARDRGWSWSRATLGSEDLVAIGKG